MTIVWLLIAAWIGFILGFATAAVMAANGPYDE